MTNFESFNMVTTINLTKGGLRKAVLVLAISVLSLYSCKKAGLPDGVLSKEELADLMVEHGRATRALASRGQRAVAHG